MDDLTLIRTWMRLESNRATQVANMFGCTVQRISNILNRGLNIKQSIINELFDAMAVIDNEASNDLNRVKKILHKCLDLSGSNNSSVRDFANIEFKRWTDIYLIGVDQCRSQSGAVTNQA